MANHEQQAADSIGRRWLSWLRRVAFVLAALLGLAVLTLTLVLAIGPTVDLRRFVPDLEAAASRALGQPVAIGDLRSSLRLTPQVEASRINLGDPERRCARIETAELELPVLPLLLRDELRLDRLALTGVAVDVPACLESRSPGEAAQSVEATSRARPSEGGALRLIEIGELALDDVAVVLPGRDGGRRFEVAELRLEGPEGQPVTIEAIGALDAREIGLSGSGGEVVQLQGRKPWPLGLRLTSGGVELGLLGSVPVGAEGTPLEMDLKLSAARTGELFELVGVESPIEEPLRLQAHVALERGEARVTELRGEVAGSELRGRASVATGEERPRVDAELELPRLALEPWLANHEARDLREWREIAVAPFLDWLDWIDGELQLAIDEITGVGLSVSESRGRLLLEGGAGELQLAGTVAESPVSVEAMASADPDRPLQVDLEARNVVLSRWLSAVEGVEPGDRMASLRLQAETAGPTLGDGLERLEADVAVRGIDLARRVSEDLPRWTLRDGSADLRQRPGAGLRMAVSGSSNGAPVSVRLDTVTLARLLSGDDLAFDLSIEAPELSAGIDGRVSPSAESPALDLELALALDRLSAVAPWLGTSGAVEIPLMAEGTFRRSRDGRRELDIRRFRLGKSEGSFEGVDEPRGEDPALRVALDATRIDLDEIIAAGRELFEKPDSSTSARPRDARGASPARAGEGGFAELGRRVVIDLEADVIERRGVDIVDAELHLSAEQDGSSDSRVAFRLGDAPFTGSLDADVDDGRAKLHFLADTSDLDIGAVLAEEGWVQSLELEAGRFGLEASSEGSSVSELWWSTRAFFEFEDVVWLPDAAAGEERDSEREVRLESLRVSSSEAEGLQGTGVGRYRGVPLAIELATDRLLHAEGRDRKRPHPFRLRLAAEPDATLVVEGETTLPFSADELNLRASVSGSDLAWWKALLDVELPALGPYEVAADLRVEDQRLDLSGLSLTLGESRATGELAIDWSVEPARTTGALDWSELHLRDFVVEGAMAEITESERSEKAEGSGEGEAKARDAAGLTETAERWRLERDWLVGREIDLEMNVEAFYSERQNEASPGTLSASLELANGNLDLGPLHFEFAGGSIDGGLTIVSAGEAATTQLSLRIENYDYTHLAGQLAPGVEEAGRLSLYADLESTTAWGEPLAPATRGTLAVLVLPEKADAFLFDLWGDDIVRNLFTVFGWASSPSALNCGAARGTLDAGVMQDLRVLADTTRVRVKGKGRLDLGKQEIRLRLRPQPKKRSLLNLSTPVVVRGDLWDPEIRPATGALIEFGVRVATWAYTVYLQLFKQPLPPDDTEACVRLLEGYVDDERWRPGQFLLDPSSVIEEVVDPP